MAISGFIFNSALPFMAKVIHFDWHTTVYVMACSSYILYVIIGYLLHKYDLKRNSRLIIYLLGCAGILIHIVGTYCLSVSEGDVVQVFKGYLNVPCIMYSVAVFLFIKQIAKTIRKQRIILFIKKLSNYTFATYLMHWYIKEIMVALFDIDVRSIIYRVGAPFVIFAMCVLITWVIRKLPVVRKILPA